MGGNAIKISKITPWVVSFPWEMRIGAAQEPVTEDRQLVLVQVDTDAGITGWGEVTTYPGPVANRAIAAMIAQTGDFLAWAHVMMTTPNFYKLETSRYELGAYGALIEPGLDIRNGRLTVPDSPGLGAEVDLDYLRSHLVFGGP